MIECGARSCRELILLRSCCYCNAVLVLVVVGVFPLFSMVGVGAARVIAWTGLDEPDVARRVQVDLFCGRGHASFSIWFSPSRGLGGLFLSSAFGRGCYSIRPSRPAWFLLHPFLSSCGVAVRLGGGGRVDLRQCRSGLQVHALAHVRFISPRSDGGQGS